MLEGTVQSGSQQAREHGYPTANIFLDDFAQKPGTYAAHVRVNNHVYAAAAFVHQRDHQWICETHILDQELDLYGKLIQIELLSFISDVAPYESFEQMQSKIDDDMNGVRTYHQN